MDSPKILAGLISFKLRTSNSLANGKAHTYSTCHLNVKVTVKYFTFLV